MKDYSSYTMEELKEMSKTAFSKYYKLAIIPCGKQPDKLKLDQLQRATEKYESIREEIEKRL